jgi:hypothetical protein
MWVVFIGEFPVLTAGIDALDFRLQKYQTSRTKLDALEASEPTRRQGRELKYLLPEPRRRREDAFAWFEIRPDDSVRRLFDSRSLQ